MHDGLVNQNNVLHASKAVLDLGAESIDHLADKEPVLAEFIDDSATQVAGKMALAGCDAGIVRGVYSDTLTAMVIALEALRDGHFQLWMDEGSTPIEETPPDETEASG